MSNKPKIFSGQIWHGPKPCGFSRRDFIQNGLATMTMAASLPAALLAKSADAATPSCPPQTRMPGALAQIYREGGNNRTGMFFPSQMTGVLNATIAKNWGILGASDLVQVGSNYSMAKSGAYAKAVMTPPAGYTQAAWNAALAKTSLGTIFGPWNSDDGGGVDLGSIGGASPWKSSQLGQDVRINNGAGFSPWAQGLPAVSVPSETGDLKPSSVSSLIGLFPANVLNSAQLTTSASTAYTLSSIFSTAFGLTTRSGATTAVNKTYCAFSGNSIVADPNFAGSILDPTKITALSSKFTMASLSNMQKCLLGSFYASAIGSIGGVMIQQGGNDYHNAGNNVGIVDYEAGQYLQMFIAACDAAGTPGAFIDVSNGHCGGTGTSTYNYMVNGAAISSIDTNFQGADSGGYFNAGYIILYNPTTAPTVKAPLGVVNKDGSMTGPSTIASVPSAMAYLYLTALQYIGADVNTAFAQMSASGAVTGSASSYILLG